MKSLFFVLILFLLVYGCKSSVPYKSRKDLIGNWNGKTIEIISHSSEKVSFAVHRYGYSTLVLNDDGSYFFSMEITRDVILEKKVFGNSYAGAILQAGYKNYMRGHYSASASELFFYGSNHIITHKYKFYFDGHTLYTEFTDKKGRHWKISWEK
jgi:hypothetical protein